MKYEVFEYNRFPGWYVGWKNTQIFDGMDFVAHFMEYEDAVKDAEIRNKKQTLINNCMQRGTQ